MLPIAIIPTAAKVGIVLTLLPIAGWIAMPYMIGLRLRLKQRAGTITRWQDRVQLRFRSTGTYAWMFAWFKMRLDPMFGDLPGLLRDFPPGRSVIDLGCGYGVAANCLLEWCPQISAMYGIDPDPARVPVARKSFADRGTAFVAGAPDFEVTGLPATIDTAVCLDMIHFLPDEDVATTFARLHGRLAPGGYFHLRSLLAPAAGGSFLWNLQVVTRKFTGDVVHHRSAGRIEQLLRDAGFSVERSVKSTPNDELHWFIARKA